MLCNRHDAFHEHNHTIAVHGANDAVGLSVLNKNLDVLTQVVEDFGLVSFTPLMVEDQESMKQILAVVDKANGYVWGSEAQQQPYSQFQYSFEVATINKRDLLSKHQQQYANSVFETPAGDAMQG